VIRLRPHAVQVRYEAPAEQLADDAVPAVTEVTQAQAFAPAPAPPPRRTVVQPQIPVAAATRPASPRAAYIRAAAVAALPRTAFQVGAQVRTGNAPVVVQLGAFSTEANAERAWQ